jgi:hypothetical protein
VKRKNSPGCYCCLESDCYELQPEDLPDVSITGWTAEGGWEGNACCKCITLVPDDPVTVESCYENYGSADVDIECSWDLRAIPTLDLPFASAETCPVPDSWCCPGPVIKIGEGSSVSYWHYTYNAIFAYTPIKIEICISKQDVTCGEETTTKYVLLSRYCYEVKAVSSRGVDSSILLETTFTNSCFEEAPLGTLGLVPCDQSEEQSIEPACSYDDLSDALAGSLLLPPTQICFERVKFLDSPPDGEFEFTDLDDGDGCTWERCHDFEYTTEYCFEVASFIGRPCWCDYDFTIVESTVIDPITSVCGCNACLVPEQLETTPGTNYVIIDCDNPELVILKCCPGRTCGELCYNIETTCYEIVVTPEPDPLCLDSSPWDVPAWRCTYCETPQTCAYRKPFSEETEDCYKAAFCGGKNILSQPKNVPIKDTATGTSWSIECSFAGAFDFCITAPQWTVTFG